MDKDRLLLGAVIVVIITYYYYQLSGYIHKVPTIKELQYHWQQASELSLADNPEEEQLMVNACCETLSKGNNDNLHYEQYLPWAKFAAQHRLSHLYIAITYEVDTSFVSILRYKGWDSERLSEL